MDCHIRVLIVYFIMFAVGGCFIYLRKKDKNTKEDKTGGSKKKIVLYVAINLAVICAAWAPYHIFTFLIALISALASYEIVKTSEKAGGYSFIHPFWYGLTSFLVVLAIYFLSTLMLLKVIIFFVIVHMCVVTFYKMDKFLMQKLSLMTVSIIYIPAFLGCLVALQIDDPTGFYVVFVYIIVAATDAFAEIFGEMFGKTRFAPALSPNKTVEGAIGGTAASLVIAAAISCCLPGRPIWLVLLFALTVSAAAQLGDLIASAWKRNLGIKDFGSMLGAHGGIIDRFDSAVFASGVFYLLITGYQILK